jgi:hypothetical protein
LSQEYTNPSPRKWSVELCLVHPIPTPALSSILPLQKGFVLARDQLYLNRNSSISFSPAGRRRGPSEAWEDEGEPVIQLRDLLPSPSTCVLGPFLSPRGRGKVVAIGQQLERDQLYVQRLCSHSTAMAGSIALDKYFSRCVFLSRIGLHGQPPHPHVEESHKQQDHPTWCRSRSGAR